MLENFDSLQAPVEQQDQSSAEIAVQQESPQPKSYQQEPQQPVPHQQEPPKIELPLEQLSQETWLDIYPAIGATGVLQSTISNCVFNGREGTRLSFTLDQANATLYSEGHQARFAELLSTYFSQDLDIEVIMGTVTSETPASRAIRLRQERHAQAVQMVTSDPLVQSLVETFAITIDPDQIQPV
jgi:DNA polymerase-3 subunit gamma/tau